MWAPKRLEIGWCDLALACLQCLRPPAAAVADSEVARGWIESESALTSFSVRSGFDLLLAALDLPEGSEVLLSAINIPDMAQLVRRHGLVAVPVDVDPNSYHPTATAVQKVLSPRTRMLVIAHLFGGRGEVDEIVALAARHGVLLVEDCAQAFSGRVYTGHTASDVAMFSFGPIKTATALGGAVLRVKDTQLVARMHALQQGYPRQKRWQYFARVLKYTLLKLLTTRPLYGPLVRGLRLLGRDHDHFIRGKLRNVGNPNDLLRALRYRPSEPLLWVLRRRIQTFDEKELTARSSNARRLATELARHGVATIPPRTADTFWVYPYRTLSRNQLAERLLQDGFDIVRHSSLAAIEPTALNFAPPHAAQSLIRSLVFLPTYKELPPNEIDRLAGLVAAFEAQPPEKCRLHKPGTAA